MILWEDDMDPINDCGDEDERTFPCACGEPGCEGWYDDNQNIRIGKSWWAADCVNKPLAVTEDQDRAMRDAERAGK